MLTTCLLLKNAVYLQNYVICPFPVHTFASGHRCVLGLVSQVVVTDIFGVRAGNWTKQIFAKTANQAPKMLTMQTWPPVGNDQ